MSAAGVWTAEAVEFCAGSVAIGFWLKARRDRASRSATPLRSAQPAEMRVFFGQDISKGLHEREQAPFGYRSNAPRFSDAGAWRHGRPGALG